MFADPQVKHLGMAQPVKTRDKDGMTLVGQPFTLSRTPSRLVAPPPALGEHTGAVLKEFGFSAKEIAKLREAMRSDPFRPGLFRLDKATMRSSQFVGWAKAAARWPMRQRVCSAVPTHEARQGPGVVHRHEPRGRLCPPYSAMPACPDEDETR